MSSGRRAGPTRPVHATSTRCTSTSGSKIPTVRQTAGSASATSPSPRGIATKHAPAATRRWRCIGPPATSSGIANSLFLRGEVDFAESNARGREWFEEALALFRALGNTKNEASCTLRLAAIALATGQPADARTLCGEAAMLYRRFGDLVGEADVLLCTGDIELHEGRREQAAAAYTRALVVFEKFGDAYSAGVAHGKIAKVLSEPADRREHADKAAVHWRDVHREDLIDELEAGLRTE